MKKNAFITGTLWLSGAGLITRLLGFVYRIYLSNLVGSEGMGLYQLLVPVYFLLFTLCSSGIHMAVSRTVASLRAGSQDHNMTRAVLAGLIPSCLLSLLLSVLLFRFADVVALLLLREPRTAAGLRILCLSLPFCALSSACKAYFHGMQQMAVPAVDQILEQLIRMGAVFFVLPLGRVHSLEQTCALMMAATAAGDILSSLYVAGAFLHSRRKLGDRVPTLSYRSLFSSVLLLSLPVTGGRVLSQLLSCFENIMLPSALRQSGLSASQALSLFGVFSGMVMPILLFPSVLTGSLSANLLPLAAEAHSRGNFRLIHRCIDRVVRFTFLLAFLCTALLASLGDCIGSLLYPGTQAGSLLVLLACFCPFLYLQGTLGGLLNGLGLQNDAFLHQLAANTLVVLSILLLVPHWGFPAFLAGYLLSLVLSSALNLRQLLVRFQHRLHLVKSVGLPLLSCLACVLTVRAFRLLTGDVHASTLLFCTAAPAAVILFYLATLLISGALTKKDLKQVLLLFH